MRLSIKQWQDAFEHKGVERCKVTQLESADRHFDLKVGDILPITGVGENFVYVNTHGNARYPMYSFQVEPYLTSVRLDVPNQHYQTKVQPIETMQANMTREELIGFLKGNIIKYVCRCGRKDAVSKETAKIKQYAEWLDIVANGGEIVIEHKSNP